MGCPISSSNTSFNGTPVGVNGSNETLGGVSYKTVWIGNKRWLAENLRGNFNLPALNQKTSAQDWANTLPNSAAWCYINNSGNITSTNANPCDQGSLYNARALENIEAQLQLLGTGWRIATQKDFSDAYTLLNNSGNAFKSSLQVAPNTAQDTAAWYTDSSNQIGTNIAKFNATAPGVIRNSGFNPLYGYSCTYWTTDQVQNGYTPVSFVTTEDQMYIGTQIAGATSPDNQNGIYTTNIPPTNNIPFGYSIRLVSEPCEGADYTAFAGLNNSLTYDVENPIQINQFGSSGADYPTIWIGAQKWMAVNLADFIENVPLVTDSTAWSNLTTPGCCYLVNQPAAAFASCGEGLLFNWYALAEINAAAAPLWRVPTSADRAELATFLGGSTIAGGALKTNTPALTTYWFPPNTGATNSSGFSGVGSAYRFDSGSFNTEFIVAWFWEDTLSSGQGGVHELFYDVASLANFTRSLNYGLSVRLLIPSVQVTVTIVSNGSTGSVTTTGVDSNIINSDIATYTINLRNGEVVDFTVIPNFNGVASFTALPGLVITGDGTSNASASFTNNNNGLTDPIEVIVTFSPAIPGYDLIVTNNVNFEGVGYLNSSQSPVFIDGICTKFKFDIKNVGSDPTPTFDTSTAFEASENDGGRCNSVFGQLTITHSDNTPLLTLPPNTNLLWGIDVVTPHTYTTNYDLQQNEYVSVEYIANFSGNTSNCVSSIPWSGNWSSLYLDSQNGNAIGPAPTSQPPLSFFPFQKINQSDWITVFNSISDIASSYNVGNVNVGNSYTFSFTIPQVTIQTLRFNITILATPFEFTYEWFDENNVSVGTGTNSPEIPPLTPSQTYRVEVTWTPQSAHPLNTKIVLAILDCDGETTSPSYKVESTIIGTAIDPNGGTITNLNCNNVTVINGPLVQGVSAAGASFNITYSGGDGGQYGPQIVSSTGVTGLTATLTPSTGSLTSGTFTFNLAGTPSEGGTAAFNISFPGPNNTTVECVVSLEVTPVIILEYLNCSSVVYPQGGPPFFTNTSLSSNLQIGYDATQGGVYAGDTIQSTGVTGLTLTLNQTTVTSNSSGNFTGTISGIATQAGQACFLIAIGGYEGDSNTYICNLCIAVEEQSATISSIDCSNPLINGTVLYPGAYSANNNITITVSYTGGNGGAYPYTAFNSNVVTGLTAYLLPGNFAGSETSLAPGTLTFTIIGTPSGVGTAIFPVTIGGQSCQIQLPVSATEGTISSLDCVAATTNTILISGASVNGIVLSVPYTGGNGGAYNGQTLTSNFPNLGAVTGTLAPGTLAVGNGSLSITLSGTMPTGFVPITFDFEFPEGSEPCLITLTPQIDAGTAEVDCNSLNVVGTITYPTPIPVNNPVQLWLAYSNSNGGSYGPATFISQAPGVGGLTATLPQGQFSENDGFVQLFVTGTPQSSGNAIFIVNIGGTECTLTVPVSAPQGQIQSLNCANAATTLSAPLISGQAISGTTFSVNYFGSNGGSYLGNTANSSTIVTGITAQSSPGVFSQPNGSVLYTLTGTPVGSGNATFTIQVADKSCTVTLPVSAPSGEIDALNCNAASFSGSFTQGFSGTVNGTIPYTGGNGGQYATYINTQSGLTLTIPAGNFNNGAGNVNFTITGTSSTAGNVTFPISLGTATCNLTITVQPAIAIINDLRCGEAVITGLLSVGQSSNVVITIPYSGSNEQPYPQNTSNSTGVTGLTATTPSGTLTDPTGTLVYTVTGTPQSTGNATFQIIIGTQSCTISIPVNNSNYFGPESPSPCQEVTYTDPGCEVLNETCTVLVNGDEVSYTTVSTTDPCQISFQVPCDTTPGSTATITFEDCNGDVIIEEDLPIGDSLPIYPTQDSGCPGDTITVLDASCILLDTTSIEICTDSGCVAVNPTTVSIIQNGPLPCSVSFTLPASIPAPIYPADSTIEFEGSTGPLASVPFTVLDCPTEEENTFDPPGGALPGDEVTFTNPNCDIVTEDLDQILINGVPATITGTTPAPECSVTFNIPTGIDCGNSTIEFIDELGNVIGSQEYPIGCEGNDDGTYTVTFTPQDEGCHLIYFKTTGEDYCVYQADGPFEVGVPVTITINLIDYADCLGTVPPVSCVDPLRVTGFIRPCCTQDGSKDVDLNFVEYQTSGCQMYSIECVSNNCGTFTRSNCSPSGCYGYVDPTLYSFTGNNSGIPGNTVYMCAEGNGIQNTTNSTYVITEVPLNDTRTLYGQELLDLYPFNDPTWTRGGDLNWDPFGICPYPFDHVYVPENSSNGTISKNGILTVGKKYAFEFSLYTSNIPITITVNSGANSVPIFSPGGFFPAVPTTNFVIAAASTGITFTIPSVPKGACFILTSLREVNDIIINCCNCLSATVVTNSLNPIEFYYTKCTSNGPVMETVLKTFGQQNLEIDCVIYGSVFPVNKSDVVYIESISYEETQNACL